MLLELFVSTTVNTKLKDNQTMFSASVLAWRILFRSVIGAGMLLELFVSTTVNTKLKEKRTMFSASVLAWRILFRSVVGAGMLLELFVSTTVNTKLKDPHHLRPACRRSPRQSDPVQCFAAGLENFVPVRYRCWHAPRIICIHHRKHQAQRQSDPVQCFGAGLENFVPVRFFWKVVLHWLFFIFFWKVGLHWLDYANRNPTP
jgi:hypothetical protein